MIGPVPAWWCHAALSKEILTACTRLLLGPS
jgi:hypothetical protein